MVIFSMLLWAFSVPSPIYLGDPVVAYGLTQTSTDYPFGDNMVGIRTDSDGITWDVLLS
nr:hypothetical protein [Rosenbergiella collisarenosi]